jgi:propionyl-CoA carboxylase alpha chain
VRERARRARLAGRLNGEGKLWRSDWTVLAGGKEFRAEAIRDGAGSAMHVAINSGTAHAVESGWSPGEALWRGRIGGRDLVVQVRREGASLILSQRGVTIRAEVLTPQVAALAALMPAKRAAASSKQLRCPMPGVVRAVNVKPGQRVAAGDALAVVEAMKMENVLRAERDATVARVLAKPGDTLAVDAVILEFAEP